MPSVFLIFAAVCGWIGHSAAHAASESDSENGPSCQLVKFSLTSEVSFLTFLPKVGCREDICNSTIGSGNLSKTVLEFYDSFEDSASSRRAFPAQPLRKLLRRSSQCNTCSEPTTDSVKWWGYGDESSTTIEASIELPSEDINTFSEFLDQNLEVLNSLLKSQGLPVFSSVDVTCCKPDKTMDLRIGTMFIVLTCSALGASLPFFPEFGFGDIFFVFRSLSAGVILGLAFAHIMPDSISLNEKTSYGSLNGVFVMVGILLSFMSERIVADAQSRKKSDSSVDPESLTRERGQNLETDNAPAVLHSNEADDINSLPRFKNQVLLAHSIETGIVVHTVLLGIETGVWQGARSSLVGFAIAMGFHQFFEGIGLGICIKTAGAAITMTQRILMIAAFSLSFPISICVGIGLTFATVDEELMLWFTSALNATAGGMLVYMGMISFLAEDFLHSSYVLQPDKHALRVWMTGALAPGMAIMSVIGIWG